MDTPDEEQFKSLLQSLEIGVALVEIDSWVVLFENARFFNWFPLAPELDGSLAERLSDFKSDRALSRLEGNRPYTFETESKHEKRAVPIRITLTSIVKGDQQQVLVQCFDISKERQAEYMHDSYSTMAERHAKDLQKEKDRVEKLLLNIMPKAVYEELTDFGTTTPHRYESASILILDFVRFTEMTVSQDPSSLVSELNDIFSAFDRITEMFGCERIRTIGDSYLAVSGVPTSVADHAQNIAKVALRMRRYLERRNSAHENEWVARIGINTGPIIGSMIGINKYVYDLFGPGVNLASRMESLAEPMQIVVSDHTYDLIKDDFALTELGEHDVKGFGTRQVYGLERELRLRYS